MPGTQGALLAVVEAGAAHVQTGIGYQASPSIIQGAAGAHTEFAATGQSAQAVNQSRSRNIQQAFSADQALTVFYTFTEGKPAVF